MLPSAKHARARSGTARPDASGRRWPRRYHSSTLGWVDEADLYALEQIVSNHAMAGYEDTGHLATTLFEQGNMAAMEYPGLGFIERCELLD